MWVPEGGHGNPFQSSHLENPTGRGAWWAIVYGVTKSQTQLKCLNMHAHVHVSTYTFAKFNSIVNVAFFFHFLTPLLNLLAPD